MYLSILIVSEPMLASNNCGENSGNLQTLQKVHTLNNTLTVKSGPSIQYALRQNMQEEGAKMWRKVVPPTEHNSVGLAYGDNNAPVQADAEPCNSLGYVDQSMGFMIAVKGDDTDAQKRPSQVRVSAGLSGSPFLDDVSFQQGHSAVAGKSSKPVLQPFQRERHLARYQTLVSFNLKTIPKADLGFYLRALRGLQVGGGHAGNLSEMTPSILAWRLHAVNGQSGLYLGCGMDFPPDEPVNLGPLMERCRQLGITCNIAGYGQPVTIAQGLLDMQAAAEAHMSDNPTWEVPSYPPQNRKGKGKGKGKGKDEAPTEAPTETEPESNA